MFLIENGAYQKTKVPRTKARKKKRWDPLGPLPFEIGALTRKLNWAHYLINFYPERESLAEIVLSFQYDKLVTTWDFERCFVFLARNSTNTNEHPQRGIPFKKNPYRQECLNCFVFVINPHGWSRNPYTQITSQPQHIGVVKKFSCYTQ